MELKFQVKQLVHSFVVSCSASRPVRSSCITCFVNILVCFSITDLHFVCSARMWRLVCFSITDLHFVCGARKWRLLFSLPNFLFPSQGLFLLHQYDVISQNVTSQPGSNQSDSLYNILFELRIIQVIVQIDCFTINFGKENLKQDTTLSISVPTTPTGINFAPKTDKMFSTVLTNYTVCASSDKFENEC